MVGNCLENKRALTLIELVFSVAIFSVIISITFSIVNYVPKLTKVQSNQFSERMYVRSALSDITRTIQSATAITGDSPIVFTSEGKNVTYKFSDTDGKVSKVIGTETHTLMESIEDFELRSEDYKIFDVSITTHEEGKTYNFKVSYRSTAEVNTDFPISTIDPVWSEFDKNVLNIAKNSDIKVKISLNGNLFIGLQDESGGLASDTDFTYNEAAGEVVIKKAYLAAQSNGAIDIVFDVSSGADPVLTVDIADTSANIKVVGNANEDEIARMNYPGNLEIDSYDYEWVLKLTNGTVKSGITDEDLIFSGLPAGLDAAAESLENNRIKVTLSGRTYVPVSSTTEIGIIIKGSAVTEPGAVDSDAVTVYLLPGSSYPEPGQSIVYTGYFAIGNGININGDVVIGKGVIEESEASPHLMFQNININGYIYVGTSLVAGKIIHFGSSNRNVKVFVNGSVFFDRDVDIFGDIYYDGGFYAEKPDTIRITGEKKQSAVEIPAVNMPALKPDEWYEENGYTIIESFSQHVDLEDNGKYFFKCDDYWFYDNITELDNVTIVSKGSISFMKKFIGSGIIAAPEGNITFTNNSDFTGALVAEITSLLNNCTFTYKKYNELPFE